MSGLLSEQTIEEIKRRVSLITLIGEYVSLKKAGTTHKGLCPFHNEKTPSFHVDEARGFYYCFGCHAGGDCIKFLREHVGYSFTEALEILAERTGVTLPERTQQQAPQRRQKRESRERLYNVNRRALNWFVSQLKGDALAYLHGRGLTDETIQRYEIGYAPELWDGLVNEIVTDWQTRREAETLGLIMQRREESKGHYDRFRNRVLFPVFALGGEVLGFQGRTLSEDKEIPKYVNSSESAVFSKGHILYGLYQAKKAIRSRSRAILVEGNVDVLTLAQHGFSETVAPMGTALTEEQCLLLKRFTDHVLLVFDGDKAGRAAAAKTIPMLLKSGFRGRVVCLPDGEDPDTFVATNGAEALEQLIAEAPHLFDHIVTEAMHGYDGSPAMVKQIMAAIAPAYWQIDDQATRDACLRALAPRFSVREDKMARWLAEGRRQESAPTAPNKPRSDAGTPAPRLERDLMALLLRHPRFLPFWRARQREWENTHEHNLLTHEGVNLVLEGAVKSFKEPEAIDYGELLSWLSEHGREAAGTVIAKILTNPDPFEEHSERAYVELAETIEQNAARRLKAAERASLDSLPEEEQIAALTGWVETR